MKIEEKLLTINPYSRPGTELQSVKGIVIHWVANHGSSAIANRNYFDSLKSQPPGLPKEKYRYASAHFIIGLQGEVVQCLLEYEMAYHVGASKYNDRAVNELSKYPNNCTIGIELCHPAEFDNKTRLISDSSKWIGKFTDVILNSASELILELCERYKLNRNNIYRHYDITGKDCPRYFVNNENEWQNFLQKTFKS